MLGCASLCLLVVQLYHSRCRRLHRCGAGRLAGKPRNTWCMPITRASLPALLAGAPTGRPRHRLYWPDRRFSRRPLDTAEAHVGLVARCLGELQFESFLLLSSTRVYARADATHEERAHCRHCRADPSDLYNRDEACRRSAVSGRSAAGNARGAVVECVRHRHAGGDIPGTGAARGEATGDVVFRQSAASAKDYVSVAAVVRLLPAIAAGGG